MNRRYDVIATVGSFKGADGKPVKRTLTIGAIFESEHGKLVLKIDAMPTSPDWSGWLQMRPCAPDLPPAPSAPDEESQTPGQ